MIQNLKHMYEFDPKVKLLKGAVQVKEHVSEAVICRLLIKFHIGNIKLK